MKRLITEIIILTIIGIGLQILFTQFIYPYFSLSSGGPVPFRTIVLVGVITYFFHKSGDSWKGYGLSFPFKWWELILMVLVLFAINLFLVQSLKDWIREIAQLPPNDYSFFSHIEGNEVALVVWLCIAWLSGGFGEEMVFRGYLMGRIAKPLGNTRSDWAIAIVVQAVIFGLGHAYAGWGAAVSVMVGAVITGTYVMFTRKSIWPLIIIHGLWDSLAVILFYLNGEPNT